MKPKKRRRVAVDGFVCDVNPRSGLGKSVTTMLHVLDGVDDSEFEFFVFGFRKDSPLAGLKNVRYLRLPAPLFGGGRFALRLRRLLAECSRQFLLPFLILFYRIEIIHFTYQFPVGIYPCRKVLTVHDMAHFSLSADSLPSGRSSRFWALRIRRGIALVDHVVTISRFSKDEILRFAGNRSPVSVIHWPYMPPSLEEPQCLSDSPSLPAGHLLFVGELGKNKNERRILEAYAKSGLDVALVLVTGRTSPSAELLKVAADLGVAERTLFFPDISEAELRRLYAGASALVYASLYEGFGLPILEAFAAGVPVITSDRAAMREIAKDAALLVDPESVDSIQVALVRIFEGPLRSELIHKGKARLTDFSPAVFCKKLLKVYRALS